jgi:hypothetical protein
LGVRVRGRNWEGALPPGRKKSPEDCIEEF